jgi:hypothetical protein
MAHKRHCCYLSQLTVTVTVFKYEVAGGTHLVGLANHERTSRKYGYRITLCTVSGTARRKHSSHGIFSVTVRLQILGFLVISMWLNPRHVLPNSGTTPPPPPVTFPICNKMSVFGLEIRRISKHRKNVKEHLTSQ